MKAKRKRDQSAYGDRKLDVAVAAYVMGWRQVEEEGAAEAWGKKQDRAGRWRKTKVPNYCSDPTLIGEIEDRLKELRLTGQYEKELEKLTKSGALPEAWASPEQKCRAALNVIKHAKRSAKN